MIIDKFEFDAANHVYTLNGKNLTGVTSCLSVIAKPALIQWSASEAVKYIEQKWKDLGDEFGKYTQEIFKDARVAHRKKKEDAGQKGTDIHAIIEQWINDKMAGRDTFTAHPAAQVQNFIDWATKNKVEFLASEKRLYSKKHWIAGTADFVCVIDGKKYVGDLKTSSNVYKEYFFQVAAYRMMLEEMGEKGYDGSIIVNVKKDGKFNEDKDVVLSQNYEYELQAFVASLTLYRIINNIVV